MRASVCIWCSGDVQLVQGVGRAASSCSPRYGPLGTEHISSQKYVRELFWLNQKSHAAETASGDCLHAARGVTLHRDGEDKEQHRMPLYECSPEFQTLQSVSDSSVAHLDHEGQKGASSCLPPKLSPLPSC